MVFQKLLNEKEMKIQRRLNAIKKEKKRNFAPSAVDTIENKIKVCEDIRKNKMIIEFNDYASSCVKSIAVKSNTNIKCTTRFMSGKLLMFAKLSLKSFFYSLVELLAFPEENTIVSEIFDKYEIERIFCYHVLTDTNSTSIQFIIISDETSTFQRNFI